MSEIDVHPWGLVEDIVLAAGSGAAQVTRIVNDAGLQRVVDVVLDEIRVRCDPPSNCSSVKVQVEFTFQSKRQAIVIEFHKGSFEIVAGSIDREIPKISVDVVDALMSLYEPLESRSYMNHDTRTISGKVLAEAGKAVDGRAEGYDLRELRLAVHSVLSALGNSAEDMDKLSCHFGTDKWGLNWFTKHYENHFNRIRNRPVRLLEIGIGGFEDPEMGGESLRVWQRYFRRGLIYGLDVFDKPGCSGPRIRSIKGDQGDSTFLEKLGGKLGPFDIIIDDGSHLNEHVLTSFRALFPHLQHGGLYVIEDLSTSYWPSFGGDEVNLTNRNTSLGMLKELVDGLNRQELPTNREDSLSYTDCNVVSIHFYHTLALIEKGNNSKYSISDYWKRVGFEPPIR